MWKRLQDYLKELESVDFKKLKDSEKIEVKERLLTQIAFFQHERLIHLIVTVTFAVLTFLGLIVIMIQCSIATIFLEILFIVLLIPYVIHYYRLENGVQKLYTYYDLISK